MHHRVALPCLLAASLLHTSCTSPAASPSPARERAVVDTRVIMGGRHTCALDQGRLWCWGDNAAGQLGEAASAGHHRPAEVLAGGAPITSVSAGEAHTCAVKGGALYCWGDNTHGQLGDGSFTPRATPTLVPGLTRGVSAVATSSLTARTCALRAGQAWCWGVGAPTPAPVEGVEGAQALTVGAWISCAQTPQQTRCWRAGERALALDGLPQGEHALTLLPDSTLAKMPASYAHLQAGKLCALDAGGGLWCGALSPPGHAMPDAPADPAAKDRYKARLTLRLKDGVSAIAHESHDKLCYVRHGKLHCEGDGSQRAWAASKRPEQLRSIATSSHLTRCVAGAGEVTCWGFNRHGETGAVPVDGEHVLVVPGLERGVTAISARGFDGLCAARTSGEVLCTDPITASPKKNALHTITGITGKITAVSGARSGGCAISAGALYCWGRDDYGQRGDGATTDQAADRATLVPGMARGVRAVVHTGLSVCALQDGAVKCWGYNHQKQHVLGCDVEACPSPVQLPGLERDVTQLAASHTHACAVKAGEVLCWGDPGERGAMGEAAVAGKLNMLTRHAAHRATMTLAVGPSRTCVTERGELRCWGEGNAGAPRTLKTRANGRGGEIAGLGPASGCLGAGAQISCWADRQHTRRWRTHAGLSRSGRLAVASRYVCGVVGAQARCVGAEEDFLTHAAITTPTTIILPR